MADPKLRPSLRFETLSAALEQRLENEAAVLDILVSALFRGQAGDAVWAQLHEAAQRDDRLAELAFAYERLSRDKKMKSLSPAAQATVLGHAGTFFADIFGDADGAEGYLDRALALAPGDVAAFLKLEQIHTARDNSKKLAELYAAAAPHRTDRGEQLRLLKQAAELLGGEPERAIKLNQEILRLDPGNERARVALEDLYDVTGRLADLARLLEQALAADPPLGDSEARGVRVRLISLYCGGLGEVERSLPHVEGVLRVDPTNEAARRVAEELLGHKLLTARAAAALAAAHVELGEPAEAARLIGVEIEALRGPKRLEAQKKLAALTLEQLGDLERTFTLDEAIVPLDPADHEVRARYVKLASALDKQIEATRTLTRAQTGAKDPAVRARIGADLGDLFREAGDARRARAAYQGVLDGRADEEATLRAARALAGICSEARDLKALAVVFDRLAELEPDEDVRIAATVELARLAEGELRDTAAAITAHRRLVGTRLEADALDALERLYEATNAHEELAGVLARKAASERDPARARDLSFRAADILTTKLADRDAAILAWKRHVEAYGATREALARFVPLLEGERRWDELAAALAAEAAITPAEERAAVLSRLGQLRLARLGDTRGALEAHRQALALDPGERQSRLAVDRMLSAGELRLEAAAVLEPLARAEGSSQVLVRVLETQAALLDDPRERLRALSEAADLVHKSLRDPRRAIELMGRGLADALAGVPDQVSAWIDRVEDLSAGTGDVTRRAAALRDALGDRPIDSEALALLARRAGEALVASGEVTAALGIFRRALAFEPSSPELLGRIDTLLLEQGSPEERLALYRAALEKAEAPARRRELLHAIGRIERRDLGSPGAAIATYRRALAEDPSDAAAFDALVELHEAEGAWEDLHAELDQARGRASGEERGALLLRLAALSVARGWLDRAGAHYGELVAGEGAVSEEVLAAAEGVARRRDDVGLLRAVIERRVAAALDPRDQVTWLTQLGELLSSRLSDPAGAAAAWTRAASAAAPEPARAAALYERVLAAAPGDHAAATRLLELYRAAEAWDRLPAVYAALLRSAPDAAEAARVLLAFEAPALRAGAADRFLTEADAILSPAARGDELAPEARAAIRSARARVLALDPGRYAEAAAAYRAILDEADDPAETRAFDVFLAASGAAATADRRWLFAKRAERAPDAERIALLLAWAEAEETRFADAEAAATLYARVVALDPEHDAALAARTRLLVARGDFEGASALIASRRERAAGDARRALDIELAAILLDRLDRPAEALDTLAAVLEASPADAAAIGLVERALARPASQKRAAELLERSLEAAADTETFVAILDRLLSTPQGAPELREARRGWFERLLERPGVAKARALDAAIRAASELPKELAFWERGEQLARELAAPERVAEAYRRAFGVAAVRSPSSARPLPDATFLPASAPATITAEDPELVEEIGRRAVEYHEEWFDEGETVIALLRRIVELAPGSTWAFERLKLVYNLGERWAELFELYDVAVSRAPDSATRRDLLEDAALAAKDLASDPARAIGYYEALWAQKAEPRIRAALERLYERCGRHRQLVDLLSAELPALPEEAAQRLRGRIAGLWIDGLGDVDPAVSVIEAMLDAEPGRAEAFELLERVMQRTVAAPAEAKSARRRAAARLKDRYRAEGRADDLVRVLEIDLDSAATPEERASRLRTIVKIRLDELRDEAGAFEGVAALVQLEPTIAEHRVELARLAEHLGRQARLAEVLAAAAAAAEGETRIDLYAQAADVYRDRLGDAARAVEINRTILDLAPAGDPAALAAARKLDRLLDAAGRAAERCDVLERLASLEPDAAARRAARAEVARIATEGGDADRAVRAFRAALAEDPRDAEARSGLAAALERGARWAELIEVLEQRAALAGPEEARADRVRVARLHEVELGDGAAAVQAWTEVRRIFGADDESADALAALLERSGRFAELVELLQEAAMVSSDAGRAADLFRKVGDLHRERTGRLGEAVAAYGLALEQRASDAGARAGLEALLAGLDARAAETRPTLLAAVASLSNLYASAGDFAGTIALLEPRLAAVAGDAARVAVLTETAGLLERRQGDVGRAFDAVFRAFAITPDAALAADVMRLADAADRWGDVAEALARVDIGDARADLPADVARELWWRVAIWQRDRRDDAGAAEAALERALHRDPTSAPILEALAGVQRRAPSRSLVTTLLRLSEVAGAAGLGALDLVREAVETAEGPVADAALAKTLAEKLLDVATARWMPAAGAAPSSPDSGAVVSSEPATVRLGFSSAAQAASWALETLVRLSRDDAPGATADLYLRGARLPFDAGERRRLKLRAAELSASDATIGIYQELFDEDPNDAWVSERLGTIYRELGRRVDLVTLRERQIAVAATGERRAELRFELAELLAESGERDRAIAALRENLAATPAHPPSIVKLSELLEAGGHDAELAALLESRAAQAEAAGDAAATGLWLKTATLAETRLGDAARAIAAHRRAAGLGSIESLEALARLHLARGEHAAAAAALETICERATPEALGAPAMRLVDAYLAAGQAAAARVRLERFAPLAHQGAALRERLAILYRDAGEWGPLAALYAEDAARMPDRAARAARLREAADLHFDRRNDPAAAIPLLEQAVELLADDVQLRLRLASARRATGNLEEAAATLQAMIASYGTRRPKDRALVHFELARVALASGPDGGDLHIPGPAGRDGGAGHRARALAELDAALKIDPAHPEILHALARLAFEEGQIERATRTYRSLLLVVRRPRGEDDRTPLAVSRAEVLFELSELARLSGDAERAAEHLESAFEVAREGAAERDRLLVALRARGRHDLLARALEARLAAGVAPAEEASILEELAALYETRLGRPAEALDALLRALSLAPPSPATLGRALELARAAGQIERYLAAVTALIDAEPSAERSIDLLLALGRALEHDAGADARAADVYAKAEALCARSASPEHAARLAEIWDALDAVYARLGDARAQEALLERRIEAADTGATGPEAGDALYRLASLRLRRAETQAGGVEVLERALEASPDPDRAEALLREALAADPKSPLLAASLERLARATGRSRTLVDALLARSGLGAEGGPVSLPADRVHLLEEAVSVAERLGDGALAEGILRRALERGSADGDAPLGWALLGLSERRAAAGDLAEAATLKERAARAAPDRERALLLEVAALAAGALGDLPRAARLYEELRAREPGEREIWQPLAEAYRRMGDSARLAALLEETAPLLEGAAERGRLRLERARMAIAEDEQKAVDLLKEVLEEDPSDVEAQGLLGDLLEKHGRKDELGALVARQLDAAKDRGDAPRVVALSLRLGALLEQQGDDQAALDAYHGALDWEAKNKDVLRQIVRLGMKRDDSLALGDSLDALLEVEAGADAADLALKLAQIRGEHGDGAAAERALEQGYEASPGDARLRDELVRRYTESGSWQRLAELHARDAEARPTTGERVEGLRRAAAILREHGADPAAAAGLLERALALDPAKRDVLLALIDAYTATGEHARALPAVDRALAAAPEDASLYSARSALHQALERGAAALADLETAYQKSGGGYAAELVAELEKAAAAAGASPSGRPAERALRLRLAEVLGRAGDVDRARAELTDLTRTDGRDRAALHALAVIERTAERWDAATAIYRRLLALEDGDALVKTALGLAYVCQRADRLADARAALERALRAAPANEEVRELLRTVYNMTGAGRELADLILGDAARAPDASARFGLLVHAGRLLLDAEDAGRATPVLEEARSLRPEDGEATLLLADAYTIEGRLAEARAVLDAAATMLKGRRSKQLAAVFRRLARLDLADGRSPSALGAMTRAFDNDPQNAAVAMELGMLAVELDEHEVATRAFRTVTLMKSATSGGAEGVTPASRALAYYHLGRMALVQGDRRKARMMIDKAVADDPTLAEARALLDQLKG